MKYVRQLALILGFSFLGEALHSFIPLPIPASIYGLVLLFTALGLKLIKVEHIKETGSFLTILLPLLFVSPVVSLLDCWSQISSSVVQILIIVVGSTLITFGLSGGISQLLLHKSNRGQKDNG